MRANSFLASFSSPLLALPRMTKRAIALVVDVSLCVLTVWVAYYLRLGEWLELGGAPSVAVLASVMIAIPLFIVGGFYRQIFRFAGSTAMISIVSTVAVYGLCYSALVTAYGLGDIPRTIGIIQPILLFMAVSGVRLLATVVLGEEYRRRTAYGERPPVLIYGAGRSGRRLSMALKDNGTRIAGFLDDDRRLHGSVINGIHVFDPADVQDRVRQFGVRDILLAMPSVGRARRNEILNVLRHANANVRTLPDMIDIAEGRISVTDIKELDIDDLLGRDPVSSDLEAMPLDIQHRVVLVTGAGGSIGSELCRQILTLEPRALLLLDLSEFGLYSIHQELERRCADRGLSTRIVPILANALDAFQVEATMRTWKPEIVYHAAAYKHVPLVEHNPLVGVRNNVFGTLATARLAQKYGVRSYVLVSTDKAVRPTNFMGASKRLSEIILQAMSRQSETTTFSMVRFGNVLGSSGSVVPLFRDQIAHGGPVTLTHRDITRYFMTIPEAAQLVMQAGSMAQGGDVFVLDMGEPVKIYDLACRMIELSGLTVQDMENPNGDIPIEVVGLRPGEKLYEELLIGNNPEQTQHPRIMRAVEGYLELAELDRVLTEMNNAIDNGNIIRVRELLTEAVPEFTPTNITVDRAYLASQAA